MFLNFNITSVQDGPEQTFHSSFAIWKQIFIKYIKLVAQENIQIMKTQCCIIVVSIAKLSVVLQMCLQTISSSVLSSDSHLNTACVCKFNLGSLHELWKLWSQL